LHRGTEFRDANSASARTKWLSSDIAWRKEKRWKIELGHTQLWSDTHSFGHSSSMARQPAISVAEADKKINPVLGKFAAAGSQNAAGIRPSPASSREMLQLGGQSADSLKPASLASIRNQH
jgi:hypothetical protein